MANPRQTTGASRAEPRRCGEARLSFTPLTSDSSLSRAADVRWFAVWNIAMWVRALVLMR